MESKVYIGNKDFFGIFGETRSNGPEYRTPARAGRPSFIKITRGEGVSERKYINLWYIYPQYIYDHEGEMDGTRPPTLKNVA